MAETTSTGGDADVLERARALARDHLWPHEAALEEHGTLSAEAEASIREAVLSHRLNAVNQPERFGGQGMSIVQQCIVNEEVGSATNALWARVWQPPICLSAGTPEQVERYLIPACAGDLSTAFATTEPDAGSDAGGIRTAARMTGNHYVIDGEKCFASLSDTADLVLLTTIVDGDPAKPTMFLVPKGTKGFRIRRSPLFAVRDGFHHPEVDIEAMEMPPSAILGRVGQGFDLTKDWFVEARMAIAARSVGMAARALDMALGYARTREQFGRAIIEFQGIEFRLADMTAKVMAGKSLVYRVAREMDAQTERRRAHGKASAAKLFCSEMAFEVVDAAAQIFGGRSFIRENPIERLTRDVRAERIWEGTSDIQRVIIGNHLRKRGHEDYTALPG